MARRSRTVEVFGLAFLDLLSCGLGSLMLLFVIASVLVARQTDREVMQASSAAADREAQAARARVRAAEHDQLSARVDALRAALTALPEETAKLQGLEERGRDFAAAEALQAEIAALQARLAAISVREPDQPVTDADQRLPRASRVVFLVDSSGSMLGASPDEVRSLRRSGERSAKWDRVQRLVGSLVDALPAEAQLRMLHFAATTRELGGVGWKQRGAPDWAKAADELRRLRPNSGSDLGVALAELTPIVRGQPPAELVYVITDGLPTRDGNARGDLVGAEERLHMLRAAEREAAAQLRGWAGRLVVVLMPWSDDADAADAYWHVLLREVRGSVVVFPTRWP